ncbi:MAG: hypothetical protein EBS47_11230 [Betaproteobacteria bacterium]|nr:hypothetical protein [Betaproteobacteria bacterium]NBT11123.1 hypothetical protein [Betaproteobacteria bacterium]NBU50634.1 hypothetical protein [Betaproteobacteria bacterium]NBX95497.1 hypothetical protein [Betaproteobacteria bacterium]
MTPSDAAWHLVNAAAAPFWVALLSVLGLKLLWRGPTVGRGWAALLPWAYLAALAAHVGAWAYWGAEGTMAGYGLMVLSTALALWVRAFMWPGRR